MGALCHQSMCWDPLVMPLVPRALSAQCAYKHHIFTPYVYHVYPVCIPRPCCLWTCDAAGDLWLITTISSAVVLTDFLSSAAITATLVRRNKDCPEVPQADQYQPAGNERRGRVRGLNTERGYHLDLFVRPAQPTGLATGNYLEPIT